MAAKAQEAEAAGQKLVYVGLVDVGSAKCTVGLKARCCDLMICMAASFPSMCQLSMSSPSHFYEVCITAPQ